MSNRGSCMMRPETRREGSEKGKQREGLFLPLPLLGLQSPAAPAVPGFLPSAGARLRSCCIFPRAEQTSGLGLRALENSDLVVNFAAWARHLQ